MSDERILLVEDDGILAIHLQDLLERQGYSVMKPIASGEEAIIVAKQQQPALILMDIELGGKMNGITAAEKITAEYDIPIIFLTGFSHDPLLQEAKFAAPYGYLVKPVPERELAATIEMAIYKHQLDHQVKASESKYRSLIEQASDGIFLSDQKGNYIDVNSAGCALLGYSRQEILELNLRDFIPPQDLVTKPLRLVDHTKVGTNLSERRMKRKDGSLIDVEISSKWLVDGNLQEIVRDITERKAAHKQLELNENRLRLLVEISHYQAENTQDLLDYSLTKALELTDSKFGYIYLYDEISREFTLNSWSKDVMQECAILDPQTIYQLEKTGFWGEAVRQRKPIMDNNFKKANPLKKGYPEGHVHLTRFLTVPVFIQQKIVAVVGMANKEADFDSTDVLQLSLLMDSVWKIVERKQNQDLLTESEIKYRSLFENLITGFALHETIVDDDGHPVDYRFLEMNPAFEKLTGLVAKDIIGRSVVEALPGTEPFWIETYGRVALTGKPIQFEHYTAPLSKYFEVLAYCPKPGQFATIFVDISERKQEEELLRNSREALNRAQTVAHVGSWEWNIKEDKLSWSDEMYRIFGIDKENFTGKLDEIIPLRIHPDDIEKVDQSNSSVKTEGKPIPLEYRVILPDNSIRDVWAEAGDLVVDENGNSVKLTGIVQDITERKKDEEYHRNLENKFSKVFQTTPDAISISRLEDGKILDINEGYTKVFGFVPSEVIGKTSSEINLWPNPEDRKELAQVLMKNGEIANLDIVFRKKDESLINCLLSARTIEIDGEMCLISISRDISDRKLIEDALHQSEEWSRYILEHVNDGIHIDNSEDQIVQVNSRFCEMMGYTREELLKMHVSDLQAPEVRKFTKNVVLNEINYNNNKTFESLNLHSSGSRIPVEVSVTRVETPQGEMFISLVRDISERKKDEEFHREQDKLIRTIFDTVPVGIFVVNKDGKIDLLNPAGKQIWEGERLVGLDDLEEYKGWWRSTGERVKAHDWGSARAYEKGETVMNEEIEIECFNGKHKIISNTAIPLIDEAKKIYGAVVVVQDITERTKSSEELQRRNEYLAAMQETTIELISQLDLDKLLENITVRAGQLMGTSACFIDLIDPETGLMVSKVGKGLSDDAKVHPVRQGEGVVGIVWETGRPLIINDYDHWSGKLHGYVEKEVYSVIGVPLLMGDKAFGVLELAHEFSSKKEFEPEAVEFLAQFARLATIAIQNAKLYTQVKQELAERRTAEAALKESELRFHQMFAEHKATMLLLEPSTGKIIDANPAASRFYGYSIEQLRSMQISEINLLKKEKISDAMSKIVEQKSDALIFPHRLANGEVRTVEVHSSPIDVNNKKILFSIVHDITERKQAETQVQQQLDELRRWHSVTLGRESRVMELKYEVNELLTKAGLPPRYAFTQEPEHE